VGSAVIELALHYARQGWPVFPLLPGGKTPAISKERGGHGCLDATIDSAQIERWWTEIPDANIGIATGVRSCLLVIDIDPRKCETWLVSLRELALPPTFTVRTWSGGWHLYFAFDGQRYCGVTIGTDLLPGIDWRGTGGYVVGAGSVIEGATYTIAKQLPIARAPAALIERIQAARKQRIIERDAAGQMVIPATTRNDRLFRIGCAVRRFGVDFNAILETLRAVNADHCSPALADEELRTIAASAARYEPSNTGGPRGAA
jgi:Bifunctional DNA primase/polymerase, N-terminal/Primase C terminal 1 (PriCT-1)